MKWGTLVAFVLALSFGFAIVFFAACGSDEPSARAEAGAPDASDAGIVDANRTPFTVEAMRGAADAFNAKYCAAFEKFDSRLFELTFGSDGGAACKAAGGLVAIPAGDIHFVKGLTPADVPREERYFDRLSAPYAHGSRLTPDALRECAVALDLSTRAAWVAFEVEHVYPAECSLAFVGYLPPNSPCGSWNQCASGRCFPTPNSAQGACGTCVDAGEVDRPCPAGACAAGATCRDPAGDSGAQRICVRYADAGAACDPESSGRVSARLKFVDARRPCHDDLLCNGGRCVTVDVDGGCDPVVGCPLSPGLIACDGTTKKCTERRFAGEGELCGASNVLPPCAFGLSCTFEDRIDGGDVHRCRPVSTTGSCVATPRIDNHCPGPAERCFSDHCRLNGPAECTSPQVAP